MKQRVLTSFAIIAAIIPIFFFQQYFMAILIFAIFIATFELNDLIVDRKIPLLMLGIFTYIFIFGLNFLAKDDKLIIVGLALIFFVLLDLYYREIGFNDLALIFSVSTLLGFAINSLEFLYNLDILLVVFVILVNYSSDVGAYLIGSRYGKRKLAPKISPNKTIEGSLGGIALSLIMGSSFGILFLKSYLTIDKLIFVSLIIPIVAQIGDLFFSSLKRTYNKKDFGSMFPGHGGVLDRIDSLIFSLLFMMILIRLGVFGVIVWKS